MPKTIKYDYGFYKDETNAYTIMCLNNDKLYGESLTKKDIIKNTIDFTTGMLEVAIESNLPLPENKKIISKQKYDGVFSLSFSLDPVEVLKEEFIKF